MTEASNLIPEGRRAVGRAVFVRRGQLGLTQAQAAELAGVDAKTIHHVETGKRPPQAKTLAAIAQALGLDAEELLQRIADSEPERAAS